ncbi:hypothetical protein NPIL_69281 [Nephila pilipes]|uniref:Spider venom protein n=1 Tax=Nephila pilipes TaxID=299642 RepID=A0A8X6UIB5_NEPPI|nr:hypothetical protein NPIL_69281 [Nephila pilipes]
MCLFGFDNCRSMLSWVLLFSLLIGQTKLSSTAQVLTTEESSAKSEKGVDPEVKKKKKGFNACVTKILERKQHVKNLQSKM